MILCAVNRAGFGSVSCAQTPITVLDDVLESEIAKEPFVAAICGTRVVEVV